MRDITGKISLRDTEYFDAGGFSGQVYVDSEAQVGFNSLLVTVKERHPRKRMIDTTRAYFVVEGTGTFTLDDKTHDVAPGDLYLIAPGHEYAYQGNMKLFEFNVSPDNSFKDEKLEK